MSRNNVSGGAAVGLVILIIVFVVALFLLNAWIFQLGFNHAIPAIVTAAGGGTVSHISFNTALWSVLLLSASGGALAQASSYKKAS